MPKQRGFSLLEMVILMACIGLTILIGASGMSYAMKNTRQKETILKITTMAHAMHTFYHKYGGYPSRFSSGDPSITWPNILNIEGVPVVVPAMIDHVPSKDGWGTPYVFISGPENGIISPTLGLKPTYHYVIYSLGSDSNAGDEADGSAPGIAIAAAWCSIPPCLLGTLHTSCYQSDIVWSDEFFIQAPEGKQKNCL